MSQHILYPNANDYKWKGDPNLSIVGSGFSVPRGAEALLSYNDVVFNDTSVVDKYRVLSIDGLADPDIRDSREEKPGDDGEDAYDSYYGGRTIVIRLRVEAFQLDKLRDMEEALRSAFAVMEEKPLYFLTGDVEKDHFIMCKKSTSLTKEESFQNFQMRFFREWQITLRASDPRFYRAIGKTLQSENINQKINTLNAINIGNYNSYPVVRLYGNISNVMIQNQDVSEPFNNLKFSSGVTIPNGDFYEIDTQKRTIVNSSNQNKIADLDPTSGWLKLAPGNNRISLSSGYNIPALGYNQTVTSLNPSMFLALDATNGATDLSGNGRNGAGAGGINIGGFATSPLVADPDGSTDFDGAGDRITTTYGTRRNLVANPSFETDLTGWTDSGSSVTTRDTTTFYTGTACALVTASSGTSSGPFSAESACTELLTYTASAYVKAFDAGEVGKTIRILIRETPSNSQTQANVVLTADWQRISVTRTLTAGQTGAIILVYPVSTDSPKYYLDSVMLEQTDTAGTYFDGSGYINDSGTWISDPGGHVGWTGTAHDSASDLGVFADGTTRTFTGWAYRDATTDNDVLFSAVTADNSARSYIRFPSGGTGVQWSYGNSPATLTGASFPVGEWAHFAFVRGAVADDNVKWYLNGILQTDSADGLPSVDLLVEWTGIQFGVRAATSDPFNGKIFGLAVYERGLSDSEILNIYNSRLEAKNEARLSVSWKDAWI